MSKISLKHSGGNVVSLNSPTSAPTSADVAFKLPNQDGSASQAMITDGSGNLSFASVAGGKILQVVQGGSNVASSASVASKATVDTGIQVSITPSSASSKILIIATISGCKSANIYNWAMTLQKKTGSGSFANLTAANGAAAGNRYLAISGTRMDNIYSMYNVGFNFLDTAGSTDTLIYRAAYFNSSGSTRTLYINRTADDSDNNDYPRGASWIQALEVAA